MGVMGRDGCDGGWVEKHGYGVWHGGILARRFWEDLDLLGC